MNKNSYFQVLGIKVYVSKIRLKAEIFVGPQILETIKKKHLEKALVGVRVNSCFFFQDNC